MIQQITNLQKNVFCETARNRIKEWGTRELTGIRHRVHQLEKKNPGWAAEMLQKAEREYRGELILPGTGGVPYFVGNPPKWKENPVTDKEYIWGINRMGHWNDFIIAFYMTGDVKYAKKMKTELLDWIRECPPPELTFDPKEAEIRFSGVYPWRSLETGIRMFTSWPNALKFLAAEGFLDDATLEAAAVSVCQHGEVLYQIPPILWPEANHNHYVMENLGLFYLCSLFPELSMSQVWMEHAGRELTRCVKRQITADGAQMEGCPGYHNVCMHYFCLWIILAKEIGYQVPEEVMSPIRKGLDYSVATLRPFGGCVPWADSDVDYAPVMGSVLGYRAFGIDKWILCLKKLLGLSKLEQELADCIFEAGEMDFDQILSGEYGVNTEMTVPRYSFQREINQVTYRTSWSADAYHLHFGCNMPNGISHAHIDPQSFEFSALGKTWIADPGRFTYDEANDRKLFKSAEMHSCLLVDGRSPYEYLSSWTFGPQRDGCILKAEECDGYFWTQGIHTCYFPVIHERLCCLADGEFLLIWDRVNHLEGKHSLDLYFHVDSEKMEQDGDFYVTKCEDGTNFCLYSLSGLQARILPGYVSKYIDNKHPSTRICYEDHDVSGHMEYLTLAIPFRGEIPVIEHGKIFYEGDSSCVDISVNGKSFKAAWNGEDFKLSLLVN